MPSPSPSPRGWHMRPRTLRGKVVALTLAVVLLPLLGTALVGDWLTTRWLRERVVLQATEAVEKQTRELNAFLENARQDVRYLTQLYSMRQLLYAQANDQPVDAVYWRRQLAEDFRIFARTHPTYYQIRYLDVNGDEVVRVNQPLGGDPYIVPDIELQNKAHRYYFQEASRLQPGEIYISPLDLNREHRTIERPLHPVLRYATPLYLGDRWMGVLVVNLHAQPLLDLLAATDTSRLLNSALVLVDHEGYYLAHPEADKLWGSPHDLNTGANLRRDAPEVADQVLSGRAGVVYVGDEVWVYVPIFPASQTDPAYFWVLIRREPQAQFFAPVRSFRLVTAAVLGAALLLAVGLTLAVSRVVTRPVRTLQTAVERFGRGDLHVRVPTNTDDELGLLMAAFNRMAGAIHRDMRQLQRLNQGVTDLTRQLDACQALQTAAEAVARLFDAPWVAVYRVDAQGRWRDAEAHYGPAPRLEAPVDGPAWPATQRLLALPARVGRGVWWAVWVQAARGGRYVLCFPPPEGVDRHRAEAWLTVLVHQAETVLKNIHLYVTLRRHRQQLSELLDRVITAQEEERKLVAYELHDGLIQILVGARLHLNNFMLLQDHDPQAARQALARAVDELQRAIQEGRRLIQGLRPMVLDDLGLALAVREMAESMAREHGWRLDLDLQVPRQVPSEVEITAFRIVQEALSNVRKHAQARQVRLRLWVERKRLYGHIEDDGRGFDPDLLDAAAPATPPVGLHSMRERARLLGGAWQVTSRPGRGTVITFWVPLAPQEDEDHDGAHSHSGGR